METLASVWARDPCDLGDLGQKPSSVWDSQCVFNSSPPVGLTWTQHLSPHVQRNKQLQDTLLQREEELVRLQEENNKLREFLNSSFVRNLEEKAKKLTVDDRRRLKRNLTHVDDGPFQNRGPQLLTSQRVSKRVCRNLTAQFCSESSETSSSSEPNLDLWVLRTLGLKDRDTIDTSESSSSPRFGLNSSSSSSVTASTPPSAHIYCRTDFGPIAAGYQEPNCGKSPQNYSGSPGQCRNINASGPTHQNEAPGGATRHYDTFRAFGSPPHAGEPTFSQSPGGAFDPVQTLEGPPGEHPAHWSPLSQEPSQDKTRLRSAGEPILFSPIASSSPVMTRQRTPVCSPSAGSRPPSVPRTPGSRTDLAFSMSLSPSSSVKTHSFPQGQAFVRKDAEGTWNFTWVPRQGP